MSSANFIVNGNSGSTGFLPLFSFLKLFYNEKQLPFSLTGCCSAHTSREWDMYIAWPESMSQWQQLLQARQEMVGIVPIVHEAGMNSAWTLMQDIIKMQPREYYWLGAEWDRARLFDYQSLNATSFPSPRQVCLGMRWHRHSTVYYRMWSSL